MSIAIADAHFLSWLMHDADLLLLTTTWSLDGALSVFLTCQIHAEEDMASLHELGMSSSRVIVEMRDVWRSTIQLNGDYVPRPVIDHWEVEQPTTFVRTPYSTNREGLLHHHLTTMSGSSIDVVFESLWIEEWLA